MIQTADFSGFKEKTLYLVMVLKFEDLLIDFSLLYCCTESLLFWAAGLQIAVLNIFFL